MTTRADLEAYRALRLQHIRAEKLMLAGLLDAKRTEERDMASDVASVRPPVEPDPETPE